MASAALGQRAGAPPAGRIGAARVRAFGVATRAAGRVAAGAAAQREQRQRGARAPAAPAAQQEREQQLLDVPTFWARGLLLSQQQQASGSGNGSGSGRGASGADATSSGRAPAAAAACAALALGAALLAAAPAHAADAAQQLPGPAFDVAEGEEFWGNVARYGRYFVTVMLGTGYVMVRPLLGLFKNPVTGVLALVGIAGAVVGVKVTLDAMLGLSQPFDYLPPTSVGF
jgi:hypothetical protein